jgi:hypothetical protein
MRRTLWTAAAFISLTVAGCGGGSGGNGGGDGDGAGSPAPTCTNTCAAVGQSQCLGAQVQTCNADASGCLAWGAPSACPAGQTCLLDGCAVPVCTNLNNCSTEGAKQCFGLQVQACTLDVSGCLVWSAPSNCAGGMACNLAKNACPPVVTLSWAANRESGVNAPGGGYLVSIGGQPTLDVPYASGPAAPTSTQLTTLPSGTYTVTVRAYAALDALGGTTRTVSDPSQPIAVTVP